MPQYSTERICAFIRDMSTILRALYCKLGANTAHNLQLTQCELRSRPYTVKLRLHIFRFQYSTKRSTAAIGDMSTIHRAIYCKLGASANTAYNLQFAQCELLSQTYTMYLQLLKFGLQYSTERICAASGDISIIQCALYCKHCAKYSAHPLDYAIWIVVPDIYNVFTAPQIRASLFNWTYLRCYWRCVDNSMRLILQTLCQIQRTSSRLRYLNYSSTYAGFNIQLNVSALLLEICRQFCERYTVNMVANTAHILQFMLSGLWFRATNSVITAPHI
jgi:hypothetical protein